MNSSATITDVFGLSYNSFILGGMQAEWIIPEKPAPAKVILFGRVNDVLVNSPKASDTLISFTVLNTGVPALTVQYHYTLQDSFSGALDNFQEAYEWLIAEGYGPDDIIVACDSPGGCLTVALLALIAGNEKEMPMGGLRLYPEELSMGNRASYKDSGFNFIEMNYLKPDRRSEAPSFEELFPGK